MSNEPVLSWGAVVGLVNAGVVLLVSFGFVNWSPEQMENISKFMLALGALVVPFALAYFPRMKVTPLSRPRDDRGIPLVPEG